MSEQERLVYETICLVVNEIEEGSPNMTDREIGYVVGRIGFVIFQEAATLGAGTAVTSISKADLVRKVAQRLPNMDWRQVTPSNPNAVSVGSSSLTSLANQAANSKMPQDFFFFFHRIRKDNGLGETDEIETLRLALIEKDLALPDHKFADNELAAIMDEFHGRLYNRFASTGDDAADLSYLPTVSELRRNANQGGVLGGILRDNSLKTYHPIPWKRFDVIFERVHGRMMTPPERNSMPGWVMPRTWHNRGVTEVPGRATFHDTLDARLQELVQQLPEPEDGIMGLSSEQILDAVRDSYAEWDGLYSEVSDVDTGKVMEATEAWIRTIGINPYSGDSLP